VTDIDHDTITRWKASRKLTERTAARLAAELRGLARWEPVPGNFAIAVRMSVSEGTARRAKALLADHGAIMKDATGGTIGYYVT
jgi:hypothetical protein